MKHLFAVFLFNLILGIILSNPAFLDAKIQSLENKKEIDIIPAKQAYKNKEINFPKRYLNEKALSTVQNKNIDNKDANLQIIKFCNYKNDKKLITFNVYFYYWNYEIANQIEFTITSSFDIDIKETSSKSKTVIPSPESDKVICDIIDNNQILFGEKVMGNITNYECQANLNKDMNNIIIKNVNVNTNIPMKIIYDNEEQKGNKTLNFNNINFNGNSSKESENIQDIDKLNNLLEIIDANVSINDENYFIINGTLYIMDIPVKNETVNMYFMNNIKGNKSLKKYICNSSIIPQKTKLNEYLIELKCDIKNNSINTTIRDLHLSSGISSEKHLTVIKMKDWKDEKPFVILNSNETVDIKADSPSIYINENTSISVEPKKIDSKNAPIQIIKFYNYYTVNKIKFKSIFYFFGEKIAKNIIFRLIIKYNNKIRRLDIAESIKSDCTINNEQLKLVDQEGNEDIIDYECEATIERDINNIKTVSLNSDIPMILLYNNNKEKSVSFKDINFNGNSAKESENLQVRKIYYEKAELIDGEVILIYRDYFKIQGSFQPDDIIEDKEVFIMTFLNNTNGTKKFVEYECMAVTNKSEGENQLLCDTKKNPINTTIEDLHLSSGISIFNNHHLIIIKMKDWEGKDKKIDSIYGMRFSSFQKNSNTLSGGAIAGIVIACVVVLIGVVVLIMIFRKPPLVPMKMNNDSSINKFESTDKL